MAKTLVIVSHKNAFKLIVDGNELEGVKGYELSQSSRNELPVLTVKLYIQDDISVTVER